MFQIDLDAEGNLDLILPDARRLNIPATVGGVEYIKKVLSDHHKGLRNQRGYIGTLPTQHAVDKHFADEFLAKKREKAANDKAQETRDKFGFDLDQLRISL
jgi:hypothetical protein